MNITAAMVKELRERTSSGMMECKKALVEADGDMELAIENMRKAGLAKADKKSGRIAAEGLIGAKVSADGTVAVLADINCETDFVAKADDFVNFVHDVTTVLLNTDIHSEEQLFAAPLASGQTVDEVRRGLIVKLGENISIRRFEKYVSNAGGNACYLHGNKIGVLVELSESNPELGKDIAMHIAAFKPICVSEAQISEDVLTKEREIYTAQLIQEGKAEDKIANIVEGKLKKFLSEVALVNQAFVKNEPGDKTTVGQLLKNKGNSAVRFTRFQVGEGIEKKQENFAEEVMAQVNK